MKHTAIEKLQQLLQELRDAETGCAWTRRQTWQSLAPQTLEECEELITAIKSEDLNQIRDELGDMLYHILFYCQLAAEQKAFAFEDIIQVMLDKHKRRMPPIELRRQMTAEQINEYWQKQKLKEKL